MIMYGEEYLKQHIGPELSINKFGYDFGEVERYFFKKCRQYGIEYSCDCTANENTFFKTLNYTTYSGMFIVHPLCMSETIFQISDAIADRLEPVGHIEHIKDRIDKNIQSKYASNKQDNELQGPIDAVIVMAGSNKVYEHTSTKKMRKLNRVYGSKAVIKPHPITTDAIIKDMKESFTELDRDWETLLLPAIT